MNNVEDIEIEMEDNVSINKLNITNNGNLLNVSSIYNESEEKDLDEDLNIKEYDNKYLIRGSYNCNNDNFLNRVSIDLELDKGIQVDNIDVNEENVIRGNGEFNIPEGKTGFNSFIVDVNDDSSLEDVKDVRFICYTDNNGGKRMFDMFYNIHERSYSDVCSSSSYIWLDKYTEERCFICYNKTKSIFYLGYVNLKGLNGQKYFKFDTGFDDDDVIIVISELSGVVNEIILRDDQYNIIDIYNIEYNINENNIEEINNIYDSNRDNRILISEDMVIKKKININFDRQKQDFVFGDILVYCTDSGSTKIVKYENNTIVVDESIWLVDGYGQKYINTNNKYFLYF